LKEGLWLNDKFVTVVTKAVYMVWYTLANRHVVSVWYVLPVYLQGLEFRVTYATDTLGVRHSSITTKGKCKIKGTAHVRFVSVAARVAHRSHIRSTNATNGSVSHVKGKKRGWPRLFYASTGERAGIQRACTIRNLRFRDYAAQEKF